MAQEKKILVSGATGKQGGAVASNLIELGQKVRVMTRHPEKIQELGGLDIEVVRGDFRDGESLRNALSGTDGAFVMATPYEEGVAAETEQGKAMIDACLESRVPHVVYSSVCSANKNTGIPHFDSKDGIERHLKASGLEYTILRPVWFMENFETPWFLPSIERGVLSTPLVPDRPLQMISVTDIGKFAAAAFLNPTKFIGQEIDIAGDELTMERIVREISRVRNQPLRYERIPEEQAESAVGRDWALMYRWFNERGYDVDIEALKGKFGIPLMSFRDFLDRSGLIGRKAA